MASRMGLSPRKFLEVLVPKCAGDVVRVGRTVLIPLDVAEGALRALSTGGDDDTRSTTNDDTLTPTHVDAVLASAATTPVTASSGTESRRAAVASGNCSG